MKSRPADRDRVFYWLFGFVAIVLVTGLLIVFNNSVRSLPIFIFLLLAGMGLMLGLGLSRGGLVDLALISIWIVVKQAIGVWHPNTLLFNMLEIAAAASAFALGGIFHDRLRAILGLLAEDETLLKQFEIEEKSVGLIKPAIGRLRLVEEEERSVRYQRPFSLVIVLVMPRQGIDWEPQEGKGILRAVASHVKDTTRHTDIPFFAGSNRIAVILPEAETNGANKVVNNIMKRMISARMVTGSGQSLPIQERAQIRFGFSTFLGHSDQPIHMMEAAESSLQKSLETNAGEIFQSLFIEWETVGEQRLAKSMFEDRPGGKAAQAAGSQMPDPRGVEENQSD